MNKDTHISQLTNMEYSFMLNGNTNTETEGFNVTNEPSNFLGIIFPSNYKVIGFRNSLTLPRTYYLLTNPSTKKSSIGYVDNNVEDSFNQDQEATCGDCTNYNELSLPLEQTSQSPSLNYVELTNDLCHNIGEGFNFDINYPIKKIEIKEEKLGTTIYWDDDLNPSRYLNVSDVSYLYRQEVPCGEDIITSCPIVDKLLVFPKHNRIKIEAEEVQTGGNLKLGTYEFYVAYCDLLGNEMTAYSTPTNPISIFDENNNILSQTQLDVFTNFAIKLKVINLNTEYFKYYKVVCVERNNVDNAQTAFIEGIHPTTDDTILYTHSGSSSDDFITRGNVSIKRRVDFNKLNLIKPYYDKAESTMVSGGRLWHKGLTRKEEINLQPVVNLFGAIALDWQTTIAKEDLYKSAIATSKYKGFQRDEVQPFGIRFFFKDGDYSAVFPIVGRPATSEEIQSVGEGDVNYLSVTNNAPNCATTERNKVWQIYNTASQTGICNDVDSSTSATETLTKTCVINGVASIPTGSVTLPLSDNYTNIKNYIEDNPTVDIPGITEYLEDTYNSHCEPFFLGDCSYPPNLTNERNEIGIVVNEVTTYNEKADTSYQRKPIPQYCSIYAKNTSTGAYVRDTAFESAYMPCDGVNRTKVYFRDSNFTNEDCGYAIDLLNNNSSGIGYFLNYFGDTTKSNLLTTINVSATSVYFENKLHKKALFFKGKKDGRNKLILEISKTTNCAWDKDDLVDLGVLRYTIFDNCTDLNELGGAIIDTSTGVLSVIDTTTYPDEFIVAIDAPIQAEIIDTNCATPIVTDTVFKIVPPCGCFSILTRDVEYESVEVSWDTININKVETYESTCTFFIPKVDECEPKPYTKGKFAYWESTEQYPDNRELYNSSNLQITENNLASIPADKKADFENYFTSGQSFGVYILKQETDLTCSNIRHPKMPDNMVAPFLNDNFVTQNFADTVIFPLGVSVDSSVITAMLQVALQNGYLTQKQYDNIEGFEILRGDNSIHKSIIASGLGFDMYNYEKGQDKWWYANFPFNDLGEDKFNAVDASRSTLIQHPFNSTENHMFSILSPDLALTKPALPTELSLQGFQFGSASQSIEQVNEHPKYTILGSKARTTADILAIAEVTLETIVKAGEMTSRQWFTFGISSGASLGLVGASIVTAGYLVQGFMKIGQYRYEWLKIFRDLGTAYNFAHMTVGVGEYNRFLLNYQNDSYLRGLTIKKYLKEGDFNTVDNSDGVKVNINNKLREESVLVSTGENYKIGYIPPYFLNDNNLANSTSSKILSSNINCESSVNTVSDIASPYFTLKNYVPDQWGTIDSIKWLTTNYSFKLGQDTSCSPIFGGTICISPYSVRRKTPMFRKTGMGLPDKLPFNYSEYNNIGFPRYFIDYEVDTEYNGLFIPFPDIDSEYTLDCETGSRKFYVKSPSKFYLYSYGIVNFLVESEINCHFRYGRKEQQDRFYQKGMNVADWVQEKNLSIKEPNTFYYNNAYSFPVSNTPYKYLDSTYNREIWRKRNIQPNAVIYSEMDINENDLIDPWLVYKPLNWYEYKTSLGKLIDLKDIESMQFLARFENGLILNNAIDNLADRITPQNRELGTAGIFAERPLEFKTTDLGFAGTSNAEICSTNYGHYWADAKRGKVFQLDQNGKNLEIISETVQGQPTNMKQWFREHLPFKILKYIPNLDIDNKFKGIGLNMWWDDRFSRLFITKRDYVLQPGINKNDFYFETQNNKLYYQEEEIYFDNENIFKDVSWTISFKPQEGIWNSYFSFYPDYSPFHNNFFQVGYNWSQDQGTLWTHLLNNSSFQVFQGRLNSFIVEFPISSENALKQINSVSLGVEAKRYQNNWDFSIWKDKGFNKFSIFNNTQHSGTLNLFPQKTLADNRNYPKTNANNTQDILFTAVDEKHNINYFFNRVKNMSNNIPMWLKDENNIFKEVNPKAISFTGKRTLERMKSDTNIVRLENDTESRFNITLKSSINNEIVLD